MTNMDKEFVADEHIKPNYMNEYPKVRTSSSKYSLKLTCEERDLLFHSTRYLCRKHSSNEVTVNAISKFLSKFIPG